MVGNFEDIISEKIVETLSSNEVASKNKTIHTPTLSISFRSAWGIWIWILGLNGLIDTDKFAHYLHELSRSHWEQNPAWCFSKSLLPSHSLSICATNSIMPVSRMVSLFSPVKNCSHWSDLALQLKVHYSKLIHTRLCKLFQCQDWIENNTRILVCCLKGKSFFTYM